MRTALVVAGLVVVAIAIAWVVTRGGKQASGPPIHITTGPTTKNAPTAKVPQLVGRSYNAAVTALNRLGLRALAIPAVGHPSAKPGTVVKQSPLAGHTTRRTARVVVFVASR